MNIIKNIIPVRTNGARCGEKLSRIAGVTIHNTDNWDAGADAITHGKLLAGTWLNVQQSWHYAVDKDNAVQSIPEDEIAWHAGDGRTTSGGNLTTVAIEICMNSDGDFAKAVDNAARLTADILKRHGLPATAVYQHHDWSGKNCPSQIRAGKPYSWDTFKAKVKAYYDGNNADKAEEAKPKPTPKPVKKEKYGTGIKVCTNTLATSSDGSGKVYKGDWQGTITKVVPGAKYPYLLDNGNIGWTNDAGIDTDPHTPGASSTQAKPKPSTGKKEKYGTGIKVCTNTLATSSDGSGKVYKGDWTGWIGCVIPGAKYPYRVDDSKGNAIGWTDTKGIDTDPHIR